MTLIRQICTPRPFLCRPSSPALVVAAVVVFVTAGGLVATPSRAQSGTQDRVGRMALVEGDVHGTPPGGERVAMAPGDGVVLEHLVETGRVSRAQMTLDPNGVLRLGPETQVTVDEATIDRATGASRSVLSVLLGKIELALGSLFRGEVTVETPTASLGIKGTVLRVQVDEAGRTLVAVLEGVVEVTSRAGGTVMVDAGRFTIVDPEAPPLPPSPFDPGQGTLSPSAGGPDFVVPGEEVFGESPLLPRGPQDLPREPPSTDQRFQGSEPPPQGPDGR